MSASEYPTLGLSVPVYFLLQQHVDKAIASDSVFNSEFTARFASAVRQKLNYYADLVRQREVILAAALDPRVKHVLSKFGLSESSIKLQLVEEWEQEYSERGTCPSETRSSANVDGADNFLSLLDASCSVPHVVEPIANEVDR
jgi:hypothetical protein